MTTLTLTILTRSSSTSARSEIVVTDDTYRADATSGDIAMATALAALAGESLSVWDLGRPMRDALASLACEVWS